MKKQRRILSIVSAFLCVMIFVSGCKKESSGSSGGPVSPGGFKTTDFQITKTGTNADATSVTIDYDVKNLSDKDYDDTDFFVQWKIKTTDNNEYMEERLLATPLNKGQTAAKQATITYTEGKTVDIKTLTYTIVYKP